jgi:CRISPR/Cas system-associated exonuclease Cas4 (RecB family)
MKSFLKETATYLYNTYGKTLSDSCVVFPNRRAVVFFSEQLATLSKKPMWSPAFVTISELMQDMSGGLQIADSLNLIFELHQVYNSVRKSHQSFDEFYYWGEILLNDFDDVDKYLVDAADLFQNLSALQNMQDMFDHLSDEQQQAIRQFWNSFTPGTKSPQQEDFISVFSVLNTIYNRFKDRLKQENKAWEGMVYRQAVENMEKDSKSELPYQKYFFVGFNALNNCEKALFTYLKKLNRAEFFWDYDNYYLKNKQHEAGHFIRENVKLFPMPEGHTITTTHIEKAPKDIQIYAIPAKAGQTRIIGEILETFNPAGPVSIQQTAVVLPDENLLIPLLYSLPDYIDSVNVTMGYPVRNTPVYGLLQHIFSLQLTTRKDQHGNLLFFHRHVLTILNHQYVSNFSDENPARLINSIITHNKILLSPDELGLDALSSLIFKPVTEGQVLGDYLLSIIYTIFKKLTEKGSESEAGDAGRLEKEYIYNIYLTIKRLNDILISNKAILKKETYIRLLQKLLQTGTVPFIGEPLKGIQIMGLLETRNVDFENVIILSMNEGVFPGNSSPLSFIPYNLRHGFGLPTIENQDSIFAYYFYRIIQRARRVALVYNTQTGGLESGEHSRYIYQLKYEKAFHPVEHTITFNITEQQNKPISVTKTPEIMKKLAVYTEGAAETKNLSPSALNNYIDCSLKFYYRYIAGISEQDELMTDLDNALFGTILHDSMYLLYGAGEKTHLKASDLEVLSADDKKIRKAVRQAYAKNFLHAAPADWQEGLIQGKNTIILEVITEYVKKLIEADIRNAPFTVTGLEKILWRSLELRQGNNTISVRLGGQIDRIDQRGDSVHIVDYKTGKEKLRFRDIEDLFSGGNDKRNNAAFQILLYCWIYEAENQEGHKLVPDLYFVKKLYEESFSTRIEKLNQSKKYEPIQEFKPEETAFLSNLKQILEEMFDPEIPFSQTDNEKICSYCDYNKICHRD